VEMDRVRDNWGVLCNGTLRSDANDDIEVKSQHEHRWRRIENWGPS
jgi:hypothetical protein